MNDDVALRAAAAADADVARRDDSGATMAPDNR